MPHEIRPAMTAQPRHGDHAVSSMRKTACDMDVTHFTRDVTRANCTGTYRPLPWRSAGSGRSLQEELRATSCDSLDGIALLFVARAASAQVTPAAGYTPPDDTPSIRVGVTIYADYTYTDESRRSTDADGNAINPSAFNVGRSYINVTGNISHIVAFRITPDIARESGLITSAPAAASRTTASSSASSTRSRSSTSTTG